MQLEEYCDTFLVELNQVRNDSETQSLLNNSFEQESVAETKKWAIRKSTENGLKIIALNGKFQGFVNWYKLLSLSDHDVFDFGIALKREARGKGIGTKALETALSDVPSNTFKIAHILDGNTASETLFQKFNFTICADETIQNKIITKKPWRLWSKFY